MDEAAIGTWFDDYVSALAVLGRGESEDLTILLRYLGVPLLLTNDSDARFLMATDDVLAFVEQQVQGMRSAAYDRTATISAQVSSLNATSALLRAELARLRADGSEVGQLRVTYVITAQSEEFRISALAVHSA
jgi:hypothetical protein